MTKTVFKSLLLFLLFVLQGVSHAANPTEPTNLRASIYSPTAAELFWSPSEDADGIAFYRVYLAGSLWQQPPGPSLYVDTLNPGSNYDFQISAVDSNGHESVWTPVLSVRTGAQAPGGAGMADAAATPAPEDSAVGVPGSIAILAATDSTLQLAWQPAPGSVQPAGYNVYLNDSYIDTTFEPAYTARNLQAGTGYDIYITAFDGNGNFSVPSAVAQASTGVSAASVDTPVPPAPVSDDPVVVGEGETNAGAGESDTSDTATDGESTNPVVTVDPNDFFGATLELDSGVAVPGGPPTAPRNLRANLIANDWVELNWSPSADDGAVVAYKIYRDDGVSYEIGADDASGDIETNTTLINYWQTTTYVDCNFTHIRACDDDDLTPEVGTTHSYQVSAIDDGGNESARSNTLEVVFHAAQGAVVEEFEDPYLDPNDEFLFVTDLSSPANFMDQFELVFSDEFNGSEIDPQKWTTRLTWNQEDQNIINGEMQYFVDTQSNPDFGYNPFILNGETLTISAIRTPPELLESALNQPFLSGALSSHELTSGQLDESGELIQDKFATTYGYIEGSIRVGQVPGMLTSFYLFRRWEGEHSPEIDILEYLGENPFGEEKAFQTYHYRDVVHGNTLSSPTMFYPREDGLYGDTKDLNGFHTYSVLWEPNLVVWYIDGEEVQRLSGQQISRQSMNIILYLVTGSAWAPRPADTAPFPLEIEIDYIRAYKRKPWQG